MSIKNIDRLTQLQAGDVVISASAGPTTARVQVERKDHVFMPGTVIKDTTGVGVFFRTRDGKWVNLHGSDSQTTDDWFGNAIETGLYVVVFTPEADR